MKRNKSQSIIYLYDILKSGGVISKLETAEKLEISPRSVSRYINELNAYLSNERKNEYVIYSKEENGYILKTEDEKLLTKKDILAISKVLLESRGFSKREMKKLIEKLLDNCVYKDRLYIKQIIGNEIENYVSPKHDSKLIDKLWDLTYALKRQRKIQIEYTRVGLKGAIESTTVIRNLIPQGILFSEYYFYLIAFIEGKKYEYPAIYRVDRIKNYTVLDEGFRINYTERFKEGEFRNLIQFMQSGKLQTIVFKFKGESIEAVLDRLPTAKIISENNEEYLVEAKVFGRGIKMWLLSQGDAIEVIRPKELRNEIKDTIKNLLNIYKCQ